VEKRAMMGSRREKKDNKRGEKNDA